MSHKTKRIPDGDMVCWDCRGQDLPCDTCNGTRLVPSYPISDERMREIEEMLEKLGDDDAPQNDY